MSIDKKKTATLKTIDEIIGDVIFERLEMYKGNRTLAAKSLAMPIRTFQRRLIALGVKSNPVHVGKWEAT